MNGFWDLTTRRDLAPQILLTLFVFQAWLIWPGRSALGQPLPVAREIQGLPDAGGVAAGAADGDPTLDNVDDILSLADEPLDVLAARPVVRQEIDPVVEAVSRRKERVSESPGIVDVITAEDIRQFGAKNLYEVLRWATSVYMTGSYLWPDNCVSIRGDRITFYDNHVLTLINGRPFRDNTNGGINIALYTAFPLDTVDRIEVLRGPGSVLYGTNAYVGVINVVTKSTDQPTLRVSALAGSHATQQYSLTAGNGGETRGVLAGAKYSRSEGWPFALTDENGNFGSSLQGHDNVGVFGAYRNGGFTANVFVADLAYQSMGVRPLLPTDPIEGVRVFADLGYVHDFCDHRSLEVHLTYNFDEQVRVFRTPPSNDITSSHSYLLEGIYRTALTDRLDLMLGGFADFHEGAILRDTVLPAYSEIWYGVYAQLDYRVTDWLRMTGGLQGNIPGEIPGGIVPRAAMIVSLTENWTAKFLYGQAFRSPYHLERSFNRPGILVGNPDLRPETIQTVEAQIAYDIQNFRLAATYFHSDYFDMITREGAFPATYINHEHGTTTFDGAELEADWRLSEQLRCLGSVTYQENVHDETVRNMTHVPNWMAKLGAAYSSDNGWTIGVFDTFYGAPSPVTVVNPAAAIVNPVPEAYHLVSLNATVDLDRFLRWQAGRPVNLQFLVQNLLNEGIHHPEFSRRKINSLPGGPGRTFYGGVSLEY